MLFFASFGCAQAALNLKDSFGHANEDPLYNVSKEAGYNTSSEKSRPEAVTSLIINSILSLLGVIFVGLMIYGGYLWTTAMGKEQQVSKAKDLITRAVIGLIIIVGAYAISYFVVKTLVMPNMSTSGVETVGP